MPPPSPPPPPRVATPPEFAEAACDARPLTPPPPPQIVEVQEIQHSTLERPDMTPQQLAASVAAIITAYPSEPPSATVDRLLNMLPGLINAPQRETMLFATTYAAELLRELCRYFVQDMESTFGRLERLDMNTMTALVRFLLETITRWHDRPVLHRLLTFS